MWYVWYLSELESYTIRDKINYRTIERHERVGGSDFWTFLSKNAKKGENKQITCCAAGKCID